jgi:hypothetical protein
MLKGGGEAYRQRAYIACGVNYLAINDKPLNGVGVYASYKKIQKLIP